MHGELLNVVPPLGTDSPAHGEVEDEPRQPPPPSCSTNGASAQQERQPDEQLAITENQSETEAAAPAGAGDPVAKLCHLLLEVPFEAMRCGVSELVDEAFDEASSDSGSSTDTSETCLLYTSDAADE